MMNLVGGEANFPLSSTVGLSAATVLYLTTGKADYLHQQDDILLDNWKC